LCLNLNDLKFKSMKEQELLLEALLLSLGKEELLDELLKAMGTDEANENLRYISRMHGLPI